MQKIIEVVYEKGVFKPLEPVELEEGEKTKIMIEKEKERGILTLEDIKEIKGAIKTLPKVRISSQKLDEMYYEQFLQDERGIRERQREKVNNR